MACYFLSRHTPDPLMVQHLADLYYGGFTSDLELTQYKGSFSNIKAEGENIVWEDSLQGQITVPGVSIIVAVAPPQLQIQFLNAIKFSGGNGVLLQPLTERQLNPETEEAYFKYVGLSHVKAIVFQTELIAGSVPNSQR